MADRPKLVEDDNGVVFEYLNLQEAEFLYEVRLGAAGKVSSRSQANASATFVATGPAGLLPCASKALVSDTKLTLRLLLDHELQVYEPVGK